MVEVEDRSSGSGISESGVEAKRKQIRFRRATVADTTDAFGDTSTTESRPRKPRGIPKEKRAEISINDTPSKDEHSVKGKAPKLVEEETPEKKPVGRPKRSGKVYPSLTESGDSAKLLLSFIEIASVTAIGPTGEMTEWERGFIQAPLQRIIARIPVDMVQKGGLVVDIGALTIGFSLYFARIGRGIKLPEFSKKKKGEEIVTDPMSPVPARVIDTVDTIKAGDKDGLAVPVPSAIQQHMNGAI
jgi:hypothetical protein